MINSNFEIFQKKISNEFLKFEKRKVQIPYKESKDINQDTSLQQHTTNKIVSSMIFGANKLANKSIHLLVLLKRIKRFINSFIQCQNGG